MTAIVDFALQIADQWPVFPCNPMDKRPLTPNGFKDATKNSKQIRTWWERWPMAMIGVPMGAPSGMFCADLDIKENISGIEMWDMLLATNQAEEPVTRIHQTPSGGKHYLFIWQENIRSIPLNKLAPGIEIKGDGGYIVVPPSVNNIGKEYVSNGADVTSAPEWLLQMIREYRIRRDTGADGGDGNEDEVDPWFRKQFDEDMGKGTRPEEGYNFGDDEVDINAIRAALDAIPSDDYEDWYKLGAALFKELGDAGWSLFEDWSRKSKKYSARDCRLKWRQVQTVKSINVGTVFFYADRADPNWRNRYQDRIEREQEVKREQIKPQKASKFRHKKLYPIRDNELALRDWLVPGLLQRKHLTATAAPGGTGKSLLTLCVSVMLATGRPWANWYPRDQFRTLIYNSEEDFTEMQRRAFAAAKQMGIQENSILEDWITVLDQRTKMVIAESNKVLKTLMAKPIVEDLKAFIRDEKFDALIIDPFAETFEGEENNRDLKVIGGLWRQIAQETNCAIWLIHHTPKKAHDMQGDMDALRGGSAFANLTRNVTTLFGMTKGEALTYNIPPHERQLYTRFDDAKANYSLKSDKANWFRKETVHLNNGVGAIPGDNVGAFEPWSPPMAEITQEMQDSLLQVIDAGIWVDGRFTGEYYTFTATGRSKDRWIVTLVCTNMNCSEDQARKLVDSWKHNHVLVEFKYNNSDSKLRMGCGTPAKARQMNEPPKTETLI